MALTINSSVNALRTMRSLNQTQGTLSETLRRLSSGVRVGVAADDPGRLGSTILAEAQQRGLRQSIRNLNDGLSLSQTLDGALGQISGALQRLRELGVQAANETYSAADRDALQQEALQMVALIDKAVEQTKFNGIGLLDGSARSIEVFVDQTAGAKALSLDLVKVDTQELTRKASYTSDRRGVYLSDLGAGELTINGVAIRATTDTDDSLSFSYGSGSAIAKARAINSVSSATGVTARVGETRVTANRAISAFDLNETHYFSINGEKLAGFHIDDFDSTGHLRDAINSLYTKTGVKAELDAYGQLSFVAEDGRNIQIHYSDMFTMLAVGMADTSGDETNLKGDVLKSTNPALVNLDEVATNFFGSIQSVTSRFQSYTDKVAVGGEFNRGDDHQDVVVQVIRAGGYGVAQLRIARETGSETTPVEDFDFTEVNGPYATSHTAGMEYFTGATGQSNNGVTGAVTATGLYDEGADRSYRILVTSPGSTDEAIKAVGDIYSTVLDTGVEELVVSGVTLTGTVTLGSLFHQTGENITLTFGATPRGQSVSQTNTTNYSQVITQNPAGSGVVITGTYTGDIDKSKEIRVINTGYTQGINAATLQVFDVVGGVATPVGAAFSVAAAVGAPYSIGDGLSVEFTPMARSFSLASGAVVSASGNASSYDSTGLDVTLASSTLDYFGERGSGTYTLDVTTAGRTGLAQYRVLFEGVQIVGPQVLNAGIISLADGINFHVQASTPTIGATSNSVSLAGNDNYGDSAADYNSSNFVFGGAYTGNLNDATAQVRVTTEGRVLAAGEVNTGDAAVLEYSIGGTVLGSTLARVGTFTVGEGVTFTIANASAATRLEVSSPLASLGTSSVAGTGTAATLSGALLGYNGSFTLNLDPNAFDRNRDLSVRVSELTPVVIGNAAGTVAGSGTLRVELVNSSNAVVQTADLTNVRAGQVNTIDPGLTITFNEAFTPLTFGRTSDGIVDSATMALSAGALYNNALEDRDFSFTFASTTNSSIAQATNGANGVDDAGVASVTGTYTGNFGNQTLGVAFTGTSAALTADTVTGGNPTSLVGTYNGAQGDQTLSATFLGGAAATASAASNDDATFSVAVNTSTSTYEGLAGDKNLTVTVESNLTVSITDGVATVSNVATGTNIDLGAAAFSALGNLAGLRLNIANSTSGNADSFTVNLDPARVTLTGAGGSATVDISTAGNATKTIDLSAHAAIFAGGVDPGVDLQITTPNSAHTGTATYALTTNSTVNLSTSRGAVNGVALDGSGNLNLDALLDADITTLFGGSFTASDSVGVVVAFSTFDRQVDDTYTLTLSKATSVNVTENGGGLGFSTSFAVAQDFGSTTIDLANFLPADPGFDLVITDAVRGFDDTYTLSLTGGQLSMAGAAMVADLDVRSLQVNDAFTSQLLADEFEVGSHYALTVTAPHLDAGDKYVVDEFIGTLKTGEQIFVNPVNSAFEDTVYTISNTGSVALPDGVVLQFPADGNFQVGDEVRFQARGYRGDFSVGGQYTDPAYPTTIEVEVITTGDVDGGAVLRARRLDNGPMSDGGALTVNFSAASTVDFNNIGGPGYIGQGVFMQFDLNTGAGEANRLYAGDKFYIDVVGSLSQNFGAQLILESKKNIELAYSDLNVDNKLGRMLYVGDPALVNAPGTLDTLSAAFLGVNTEESIAKINLGTQRGAEEAIRLVNFALEQINGARSNAGALQNRISQEINSLSTALYQTEVYGSRVKDADFAVEVARQSRALIVQQAGISMLRQINQQGTFGLQLVQSLLNS